MSRRFISVSQRTYDRVDKHCRAREAKTGNRLAVAGLVEKAVNRYLSVCDALDEREPKHGE